MVTFSLNAENDIDLCYVVFMWSVLKRDRPEQQVAVLYVGTVTEVQAHSLTVEIRLCFLA